MTIRQYNHIKAVAKHIDTVIQVARCIVSNQFRQTIPLNLFVPWQCSHLVFIKILKETNCEQQAICAYQKVCVFIDIPKRND